MDKELKRKARGLEIGLAVFLITLGLLFVFASVTKWYFMGLIFLPCLGLSFLVWSILAEEVGFLIPAQILISIGLAIILVSKVFTNATAFQNAAINLISMGAGWVIMPVLSKFVFKENMNWGFIPGAVLLTIGSIFLLPQPVSTRIFDAITYIGKTIRYVWPLALIVPGVIIILKTVKPKN